MIPAGSEAPSLHARNSPGRTVEEPHPLLREAAFVFGGIALVLAIAAPAAARLAASDWRFVGVAFSVYGAVATLALLGLGAHPFRRLGLANTVTGIRAGLTALVAAGLVEVERLGHGKDEPLAWALIAVVILALALDGVDGFAARRNGTTSRYGERFDMEVDALLILILSILAVASQQTGLFAILLGTMRYLYVALHAALPRLSTTLKPSRARKAICVFQIVALCAVMTPGVEPPLSNAIAMIALVLLTASFARDLWVQVAETARGSRMG